MGEPDASWRPPGQEEPPFQVFAPNLDRISGSAWRRGTITRRRLVQSLLWMLAVAVAIAVVVGWVALTGP